MNDGTFRAPALIGWQTLLADLSLILFMVTAAAMASPGARSLATSPAVQRKSSGEPAQGEPLAVWRTGSSQSLQRWLSRQQPDGRQQLTITVWYRRGAQAGALAKLQALLRQAGMPGAAARIILTPADGVASGAIVASLAYDQAPGSLGSRMAQGLRDQPAVPSARIQP